jgi:hypothetical protein
VNVWERYVCAFYGSFGWDRLLAHFCGGTKDKGKENTENKVGEMRSKRFILLL